MLYSLKETFKNNKRYYGVLIFALLILLISNFSFTKLLGDDNYYLTAIASQFHNSLFNFLKFHYYSWSSRLVIEAVLSILVKYFWLWQIFNSFVILGLIIILNHYFNPKKDVLFLIISILLLLLIPSQQLYETGWIATTLNYLWPVTFCLFGFYPIFQYLKNNLPIRLHSYLITIPLLIFALNQEQVNICFFSFLLCIILYCLFSHRNWHLLLPQFFLSLIQLIFTFITPGNIKRTAVETAHRFPDYINYSIMHKLDLGLTATSRMFFIETDFMITFFLISLTLMIFYKTNKIHYRLLSLVPISFNILFIFFNTLNNKTVFNLFVPRFLTKVTNTGTGFNIRVPITWIPDISFLVAFCSILICLFIIYNDAKMKILFPILFIMGILSKVVMGFTPTVWASGNRTGFILYICLILILLSFLNIWLPHIKKSLAKSVG
ncbi:DUF6056 family protein [Latilactobacillus fuchuensis]|uniref:DUF6056 family protein n=1 Tax=Latilactobacillus fuchuensis TaxID=164393 RepID=UPI003465AB95